LGGDRLAVGSLCMTFEFGVTCQRCDPDAVQVAADVAQLGDAVDIDQVLRRGKTHRQDRQQTLATREHLAVRSEPGKHVECLTERGRAVVVEGGRFHYVWPFSSGSTRCGERSPSGVSTLPVEIIVPPSSTRPTVCGSSRSACGASQCTP